MSNIHQTAVIHENAKLHDSVTVGPYSVIGENVTIGEGTTVSSHVVIDGYTTIGKGNKIFPFASIGTDPQDLKYHGEPSRLIIGDNNLIREYVTLQPGTEDDAMETVIGSNCLFMVGSHVAHDCVVGDRVILANNATLAGHVHVGDNAIIGGLSAVRQFARVGAHAMIGGMTGVENDVLPYSLVMGERGSMHGLNLVGLQRRGFGKAEIAKLRNAYKDIFEKDDNPLAVRIEQASKTYGDSELATSFVDFAATKTRVGLCQPKK